MDGSGTISFSEFVKYYNEMAGPSNGFDNAADLFRAFDKDQSGELDRAEFGVLLNNIFPDHCEENEAHLVEEFKCADADSGGGISFAEFCEYYDRLSHLYDENTNGLPAVPSKPTPLVPCSGCGVGFLPAVLPAHQRSCALCTGGGSGGGSGGGAGGGAEGGAEGGAGAAAFSGLRQVPCTLCGRTFAPDRLVKHRPACERKHGTENLGIRETCTDGKTLTRGTYDVL